RHAGIPYDSQGLQRHFLPRCLSLRTAQGAVCLALATLQDRTGEIITLHNQDNSLPAPRGTPRWRDDHGAIYWLAMSFLAAPHQDLAIGRGPEKAYSLTQGVMVGR